MVWEGRWGGVGRGKEWVLVLLVCLGGGEGGCMTDVVKV